MHPDDMDFEAADEEILLALADVQPGSDNHVEAEAGSEAQAQARAEEQLMVQGAATLGPDAAGGDDDNDFKVVAKRWREMAYRWACQNPDLAAQFVFTRLSLGPQTFMMMKSLQVSADSWSRNEIERQLRTGQRNYKIVWAGENDAPKQALAQVWNLMTTDFTDLLPFQMLIANRSHDFFRMLARVGAASYHYLHQRHLRYPYLLFQLLSQRLDEHQKAALTNRICSDFSENQCVMDEFSVWYCKAYAPNLRCDEGIEELKAVATEASIDISHTECQHAGNRKLVESRKVNTHCPDLSQASAQFIARGFRSHCWFPFKSCRQPTKRHLSKRGRKPTLLGKQKKGLAQVRKEKFFPKHKGKLLRGGGAWTQFLSERHAPLPVTPAAIEIRRKLAEEYAQLDRAERERLNALAETRRQAARCGAHKLTSKMSRAMLKVTWWQSSNVEPAKAPPYSFFFQSFLTVRFKTQDRH